MLPLTHQTVSLTGGHFFSCPNWPGPAAVLGTVVQMTSPETGPLVKPGEEGPLPEVTEPQAPPSLPSSL